MEELHQMIDKALLGNEVVDFKMLREVLHEIVGKIKFSHIDDVDLKNEVLVREDKIVISHEVEVLPGSFHDSSSRVLHPKPVEWPVTHEISQIDERISVIENSMATQTEAINDLTRAFDTLEKQIYGEFGEVESILKGSLTGLNHDLKVKEEFKEEAKSLKSKSEDSIIFKSSGEKSKIFFTSYDSK